MICFYVSRGLKIIREGGDYYLVHQGEVQHHLGSRRPWKGANAYLLAPKRDLTGEGSLGKEPSSGILDKIIFFIGDLEAASACAKRSRETRTALCAVLTM